MQKFIIKIDSETPNILEKYDEECYLLSSELEEEYCRKFLSDCRKCEKIVLFYGESSLEKNKKYGGDGVVLEIDSDDVKSRVENIKKELGKDAILGLITRNRRHDSMIISETEPDFIVFKVWKDGFDKVKELTDWYNDFFLIQSVAWLMDDNIEFEKLNTDFVIKN